MDENGKSGSRRNAQLYHFYFRMKVLWNLNRFLESFVSSAGAYHLVDTFPFQVQDWYNIF